MACPKLENIITKFGSLTEKPVKFLTVQSEVKDDIKKLVKTLYDYTNSGEHEGKKKKKGSLPQLIVDEFDEEQIWQQIELHNNESWDELVWEVANCMSNKTDLKFPINIKETVETEEESMQEDEASAEDDSEAEDKTKVKKDKALKKVKKSRTKTSIVDDKFFKLDEMEKFLLSEEKNEGKEEVSDEEAIDMFEDIDSDDDDEEEGGKDVMYNDFFNDEENEMGMEEDDGMVGEEESSSDEKDQPDDEELEYNEKKSDKKVRFNLEQPDSEFDESDESESEVKGNENLQAKDEKKSEFELRQQRLQQTISRLEEKTLKEAPWQLKGEVDASKRPQNSLLQEVIDFDLTTRPPPIITEQTTVTLEDIIRRRIKDKAWDDVIRKEKPVEDQLSFRKTEVLDHAKSKQSLAEVYEAEYLKQKQAVSGEVEEEKEPESHTEIREAMKKLFAKLDALSHYHYTPKAPQAEVKIVSNTPAISMEEVAPVATSDAALLAPEEVKKKHRGDLTSKEERTQTDKNRERRKKKKLQRKIGKVEKVTEHRNTKKGVEANDKSLKTSKAFFQQLNEDSTSLIKKTKRNVKNKGQ